MPYMWFLGKTEEFKILSREPTALAVNVDSAKWDFKLAPWKYDFSTSRDIKQTGCTYVW